jgi:hypothetical protein
MLAAGNLPQSFLELDAILPTPRSQTTSLITPPPPSARALSIVHSHVGSHIDTNTHPLPRAAVSDGSVGRKYTQCKQISGQQAVL